MAYLEEAPSVPATSVDYSENNLIDMVRLRMDEIYPDLLEDVGIEQNKPITSLIGGLLDECRVDVLCDAQQRKLPMVKEDYTSRDGVLELDKSILRLASIKVGSWNRVVTEVSDTSSRAYKKLSYGYIKPTSNKPVAIRLDGTSIIVSPYSPNENITLTYIDRNTGLEHFDEQMINALCWDCASKVFSILGETTASQVALANYQKLVKGDG